MPANPPSMPADEATRLTPSSAEMDPRMSGPLAALLSATMLFVSDRLAAARMPPPACAAWLVERVQLSTCRRSPLSSMPPPLVAAVLAVKVELTSEAVPPAWLSRPPPPPGPAAWLPLRTQARAESMPPSLNRPPPPSPAWFDATVLSTMLRSPLFPRPPPLSLAELLETTQRVMAKVPKFRMPPPSSVDVFCENPQSVRVRDPPLRKPPPSFARPETAVSLVMVTVARTSKTRNAFPPETVMPVGRPEASRDRFLLITSWPRPRSTIPPSRAGAKVIVLPAGEWAIASRSEVPLPRPGSRLPLFSSAAVVTTVAPSGCSEAARRREGSGLAFIVDRGGRGARDAGPGDPGGRGIPAREPCLPSDPAISMGGHSGRILRISAATLGGSAKAGPGSAPWAGCHFGGECAGLGLKVDPD